MITSRTIKILVALSVLCLLGLAIVFQIFRPRYRDLDYKVDSAFPAVLASAIDTPLQAAEIGTLLRCDESGIMGKARRFVIVSKTERNPKFKVLYEGPSMWPDQPKRPKVVEVRTVGFGIDRFSYQTEDKGIISFDLKR